MSSAREEKTLAVLIRIFCRGRHGSGEVLCPECAALLDYARNRLERCPYGADKPTCAQCPIHCYKSEQREKIREVMRYAGPRMIWRHPIMAIRHLLVGRRPKRQKPEK